MGVFAFWAVLLLLGHLFSFGSFTVPFYNTYFSQRWQFRHYWRKVRRLLTDTCFVDDWGKLRSKHWRKWGFVRQCIRHQPGQVQTDLSLHRWRTAVFLWEDCIDNTVYCICVRVGPLICNRISMADCDVSGGGARWHHCTVWHKKNLWI